MAGQPSCSTPQYLSSHQYLSSTVSFLPTENRTSPRAWRKEAGRTRARSWDFISPSCGGVAVAPHPSTLAWKIPWMEEPGSLQSIGSLRVRHDWATSLSLFTFMHWRRKWQSTPVFLPGESQGQRSLLSMGSHRVGHNWSDLAAAAVEGWWLGGRSRTSELINQWLTSKTANYFRHNCGQ